MMSHASTPQENCVQALRLAANYEETFIELGQHLRLLMDEAPELFQQVLDQTNLGSRKAYYLARIARQTEHLPIPKAQLAAINWTKAKTICEVLTKDNWQAWLELAEIHTDRDLKRLIKGLPVVAGTRSVLLHFDPKDYRVFVRAIRAHGAKRKGTSLLGKEEAIMRLISIVEAQHG